MRSADWRERVTAVLDRFAATVGDFYSPQHAGDGFILAADRDGRPRKFPLLTMSVSALDSETIGATSADAVAHLLTHVKKYAKQQAGNSFVLRSDDRIVDLLSTSRRPQPELLPMDQLMTSA
jgi:hypothetical protein